MRRFVILILLVQAAPSFAQEEDYHYQAQALAAAININAQATVDPDTPPIWITKKADPFSIENQKAADPWYWDGQCYRWIADPVWYWNGYNWARPQPAPVWINQTSWGRFGGRGMRCSGSS